MIIYKILFIGFLVASCEGNNAVKTKDIEKNSIEEDTNKTVSANNRFKTNEEVSNAIELVYQKGDTNAYENLNILYLDYPPEDFLFLALYMANKHNYKLAYYHVYSSIESSLGQAGNKLTKENVGEGFYNIAKFHLIKGAKLGHEPCIEIIKELYPEWQKELK